MSLVQVSNMNSYPAGATPLAVSSGNVANATASATLAGVAGKTTHITGFSVSGSGSTAALPVTVTITNTVGGTLHYTYAAVAGVLLINGMINMSFPYPIPANAANTAIVVSCPALGLGNTNNTMVAYGYQI